jgi:hypothetical protein
MKQLVKCGPPKTTTFLSGDHDSVTEFLKDRDHPMKEKLL